MLSHIYRFFRPKNVEDASKKRMYLAMAYGVLGWNCFMYMFYKIVINQLPTEPEERKSALIQKLAQGRNIRHIHMDGLTVVKDVLVDQETPTAEQEN